MKLVFIYGPPAARKLTIARKVADLLKANFDQFERSLSNMPTPDLIINTDAVEPDTAADLIVARLS